MNKNWYQLRWKILNRDKFTCQYCGMKAPDVILHIDHKISKRDGGTDEEDNLITSCSACNIGKSTESISIPSVPILIKGNKPERMDKQIINYLSTLSNGATGTEIAEATGFHRASVAKFVSGSSLLKKERHGNCVFYHLKS